MSLKELEWLALRIKSREERRARENLSNQGFNVAKYLPFGPFKGVIPYLFRRAEENTAVEGQTSRELFLYAKEIKRRNHSKL